MTNDKLVEAICEAIAPGIFCGFDGCTEAQAQWSWSGHTDKDRALIRGIAADALAIAQKRVNELEAERNTLLGLISEGSIDAMAEDIACAVGDPRDEIVRTRRSAMVRLGARLRSPLPRDLARAARAARHSIKQ